MPCPHVSAVRDCPGSGLYKPERRHPDSSQNYEVLQIVFEGEEAGQPDGREMGKKTAGVARGGPGWRDTVQLRCTAGTPPWIAWGRTMAEMEFLGEPSMIRSL